jgi:hypothetical protein
MQQCREDQNSSRLKPPLSHFLLLGGFHFASVFKAVQKFKEKAELGRLDVAVELMPRNPKDTYCRSLILKLKFGLLV